MLYMRGHPNDYENWANITGDPEWNYENVLPFFKKSIANYKGKSQGYGKSVRANILENKARTNI